MPETDALEQVWIGDRWPLNAGKFAMAGFENRLAEMADPDEKDAENVTITVVCNEAEMREEYDETLYGDRDELPFEVQSHFDVTVDELATILSRRTDFLHYIGHIEGSEFVCSDGRLDVEDVDSVGARAFLLNGCKSMLQGPRMLEAGSVAGIVTLSDVGNRGAIEVGRQVARMLNCGFSIGSALEVLRDLYLTVNQYVVVGNTRMGVVQSPEWAPEVIEIDSSSENRHDLTMQLYPSLRTIGGVYLPYLDQVDEYFIMSGRETRIKDVPQSNLQTYVSDSEYPFIYDSELRWSESITQE